AGIECGAVDGQPTRLFLLLVVATEQPGGHLRLLANASRLLSDHGCRARLLEAPSAVELLAALREHERRIPHGLRAACSAWPPPRRPLRRRYPPPRPGHRSSSSPRRCSSSSRTGARPRSCSATWRRRSTTSAASSSRRSARRRPGTSAP